MKKILILLFVLSVHHLEAQIPRLVEKTFQNNINQTDLSKINEFFINVDTIVNKSNLWDMDYQTFENKKDFINRFQELSPFFSFAKIERFFTLDNSPLYDSPKHWVSMVKYQENFYQIDWWFSKNDPTKLKGITICLIKKGIL